jgi:aconitate hydratase
LIVASVLSGNRNFEGRIHPEVKMNYLASPPLCVAYALAGRMDIDLLNDPIGQDQSGDDVYLRDIWPNQREVGDAVAQAVESDMFRRSYGDELFEGDENWRSLEIPEGDRYEWDPESTYVRQPPYFEGMDIEPPDDFPEITGARVIAKLGDSVTTDHISPAGAIKEDGSRRGNHEVMVRGTFANVRIRNQLAPGTEGGVTVHFPDKEQMSIYDAAMKYQEEGIPLCVIAGKEYGSGSSRDWAAKGPNLQGIKFVLAQSYERIHRSNLVGMGILPLQFPDGENAESLGLTGEETFDLERLEDGARTLKLKADDKEIEARVRIDTPNEWLYYRHGGILQFVLRGLLKRK